MHSCQTCEFFFLSKVDDFKILLEKQLRSCGRDKRMTLEKKEDKDSITIMKWTLSLTQPHKTDS